MKQTKQQKAKSKLIAYYKFKDCDFYSFGEEIYLNCQDNAGEKATDVFEELELTRKESIGLCG